MNDEFLSLLSQAKQDPQPPAAQADATQTVPPGVNPDRGVSFEEGIMGVLQTLMGNPPKLIDRPEDKFIGGPGYLAYTDKGAKGAKGFLSLLKTATGKAQPKLASAARKAQQGFKEARNAYTGADNMKQVAKRIYLMGGADSPGKATEVAQTFAQNAEDATGAAMSDDAFFRLIEKGRETNAGGRFTRRGIENAPTAAVNLEKTPTHGRQPSTKCHMPQPFQMGSHEGLGGN